MGDSMEDAGILEEDSVVVRKQVDADSGEIVAANPQRRDHPQALGPGR